MMNTRLLLCLLAGCCIAAQISDAADALWTFSESTPKVVNPSVGGEKSESIPAVTSSNIIDQKGAPIQTVTQAQATLNATKGHKAKGSVQFILVEGKEGEERGKTGIRILADISGLNPNQKHGFHIHEYGDCSAEDGSSAGAHFDPSGFLHGSPDSATRHIGDLGNLEADANGVAHYDRIDKIISFQGANSIIGKSIIVHEREDDFVTQPTGNAGGRIACGVIEAKISAQQSK